MGWKVNGPNQKPLIKNLIPQAAVNKDEENALLQREWDQMNWCFVFYFFCYYFCFALLFCFIYLSSPNLVLGSNIGKKCDK